MVINLKVRVEMTREQIKQYCDEYGIDRAEFRENLASYVESMVQGSPGLDVEGGCSQSVSVS